MIVTRYFTTRPKTALRSLTAAAIVSGNRADVVETNATPPQINSSKEGTNQAAAQVGPDRSAQDKERVCKRL